MSAPERVALVTGGASGIGRATCVRFAEAGIAVGIVDVQGDLAQALAGEIEAGGGRALAVPTDVSRTEQVRAAVDAVADAFGRLDVVVNDAGITGERGPTQTLPEEMWDRVMDVNLKGAFLCCQAAYPYLRAARGAIVNVASISGVAGHPLGGAYGPSKAGLINLTMQLAAEWGPDGIRANCVCPGPINTPISRGAYDDPQTLARREFAVPLARIGQPDDVARVIAFLASDAASYVTGQHFCIDGGFLTTGMRGLLGPHF